MGRWRSLLFYIIIMIVLFYVVSICVCVYMQGRVLDSWGLSLNAAAAPPSSPVSSDNPLQPVILLPFGATELRIAELPTTPN